MTPVNEVHLPGLESTRREIGHAGGHTPGPLLLCLAGIHGNEPAGIVALQRVFRKIEVERMSIRGEMVGLAGNLQALAAGKRYLERDLNRVWTAERIERLLAEDAQGNEAAEDREQRELLAALHRTLEYSRGEVVVLDLHTASSETVPFLILADTLHNRNWARRFPCPIVLGLEEQLEGTLGDYLTRIGHLSVALEGGRHADPTSVNNLEAAVWIAIASAGLLSPSRIPRYDDHKRLLQRAGRGIPRYLEIRARHEVQPNDGFAMRAGFRNFDSVREGDELATDQGGSVRARANARIFLPKYQGLGTDGFFLARPVPRIWLALSSCIRRLGVPALAHRLPGVSRHPERRDTLVVNPRVARFLVREIFHLLGFRVESPEVREWVVSQRTRR
ncbi:MAG: succinylglutamate desuccinylase/aspartoacylase family protein [Planctomycetota bacterium]|jgi:succinylglutamate desuccinylase